MVAQLFGEVVQQTGPFLIPAGLFATGIVGYLLLWLYYNRFES